MLTLENLAAGAVLLGLVMYAVFGGADFGGGIWTVLASGPRAEEQRESLFHAIGPVWETNHVWLIFVVVTLFTCFPKGFGALFTVLLIPLVIALIGINFRGAAFAFRHFGRQTGKHIPFMAEVFAVSSILTPFALGMAVTASVTGRFRQDCWDVSGSAQKSLSRTDLVARATFRCGSPSRSNSIHHRSPTAIRQLPL